ncbi:MAG: 1-acyl-sn-glycerol-3-phosphate acyltransferase [Gammaproteobacteria bacterium]
MSTLEVDVRDTGAPPWPLDAGTRIVFLLDIRDRFEASALQRWAEERSAGHDVRMEFIRIGTRQTQARLAGVLGRAWVEEERAESVPELWFQPLRIAWFAGSRRPGSGLFQDIFYGRITQPGYLRRRWIAAHRPQRMRHIAGAGAWTTDIHVNYRAQRSRSGKAASYTSWLQDQTLLVLELAERVARGARYKIPRRLPHQVFADDRFQERLQEIATESNAPMLKVRGRAERYLREMAASQTPFTVELITALYRAATRASHDAIIDVVPEQLASVAGLLSDRPVIFLISHKSILDTCAFSLVLFEADLPIPLTFGGINLSTPGIGALARRAGVIFLRRSFQDNAIYKAVFRRYIDHLIEKRFSLLWAMEGTRSRTGKLLPPRFGLFNYVVESILRTQLLNSAFIPVSVAYDQITEVEDYAIEQRGSSKKAEGMGWVLRFFKRGESHGRIFVRFGRSTSLPDLAAENELVPDLADADRAALSRTLAFETALSMNAATPVTATAVITLILLAGGARALTLGEVKALARSAAILIRRRKVELVGHVDFRHEDALRTTLGQLHDTGIVSYLDEGVERLYTVRPEQHHKAAYYRNTAIHHFLVDSVVEIALLMTGEEPGENARETFISNAVRLRGVLKFEFYFSRKPKFRKEVLAHADDRFKGWEDSLAAGIESVHERMRSVRPLVAHGVLRSFTDAYAIVAANLVRHGDSATGKSSDFVAECLKLGKQQLLQARISSPESVSKTLYQTGFKLVEHRGLTAADSLAARQEFERLLIRAGGCLDWIVASMTQDAANLEESTLAL